jgi:hypothetical protein
MGVRAKPWWRSHSYGQWIRGFRCLVEGKLDPCSGPVEAAHVRKGTDGAGGEKPSDWWQVPLCVGHHEHTQHIQGEETFERKYGVNMKAEAIRLWSMWPKRVQFPGMGPRLFPRSPAVQSESDAR